MRSLAGSLTDGCYWRHFISSPPTDTAHQYKEGKELSKKVRKLVTENQFTSNRKNIY